MTGYDLMFKENLVKKLLFILLVLTSCSITNKKYTSRPLRYFACNAWVDRNQDGKYDYFEFVNIKKTFHASENILFVGFFTKSPSGSKLTFRLFSPDGYLVREVTQIQLYRKTLLHSQYIVSDLISEESAGIWKGVWDVDGVEVGESEVNLTY
jgi:hypothetical protein